MDSILWKRAFRAAREAAPDGVWRQRLAAAVRRAAKTAFASVMTCVPGSWEQFWFDSDPPEFNPMMIQLGLTYFSRIEEAGIGWKDTIPSYGRIFAPEQLTSATELVDDLRRNLLLPRGINGYVVGFFVRGDGALLGAVTVGSDQHSSVLLEELRAPLLKVTELAAESAARALELARGFGVVVPDAPAPLISSLTPREQEIVGLLSEGLSDLNIGARLAISEDTVGTHVRRIFRKAGVHSRIELVAKLSGRPSRHPFG